MRELACLYTHSPLSSIAFIPGADAERDALQAPATVSGPDSSGPGNGKQGSSIWLSMIQMAPACLSNDNFAAPLSNTGN